jgi:arylsulfatase
MWIFVPIQSVLGEFLGTLDGYPMQVGSSLNAAGINYNSLKALKIMDMLDDTGILTRPNN